MLIEIGCEDLPSWTGKYLQKEWFERFLAALDENRINHGRLRFFYTNRRIIVYGQDVSSSQSEKQVEIYGPPAERCIDSRGNFTEQALSFARSHGSGAADLALKTRKGRETVVCIKREKGLPFTSVIGPILEETFRKTEIPRGMRWDSEGHKFIRPVRWLLIIFGNRKINTGVFGVRSSGSSRGHRTLSPARITAANPETYLDKILKNFVVFDPAVRLEYIRAGIKKLVHDKPLFNEDYLQTLADTVEYPAVNLGRLKEDLQDLPDEFIGAAIKKLKAVPLTERETGRLMRQYIIICDGRADETVISGYQNFIENKLEDARFFMNKDMETGIAGYLCQTKNIIYHPRWGSIYDRVERMDLIAGELFQLRDIPAKTRKRIIEIIRLCKNDLATLMVAEFPELQGTVGKIYARKEGFDETVASGVEEHYMPRYKGDRMPRTYEASIVSIIDRVETLSAFAAEGARVKGAGDPYGLRRLAGGIVEIVWEKEIDLPLKELIGKSLRLLDSYSDETRDAIFLSIMQRAESFLAGEEITHGIKQAILRAEDADLLNIRHKTDALKEFFRKEDGKDLLVPFIRIANILKQAEKKGLATGPLNESLLMEDTEKQLYDFYTSNAEKLRKLYEEKNYAGLLKLLSGCREMIDRFFVDVLVMCQDENLRRSRLALLKKVSEIFTLFADFSLIPIQEVTQDD